MTEIDLDFSGLTATFINCTLKKSPEVSNTQGLIDISTAIMKKHGVTVNEIRSIDHEIAVGVYPDMREHGWDKDEWVDLWPTVFGADPRARGTDLARRQQLRDEEDHRAAVRALG
jgi:hypothetical protein